MTLEAFDSICKLLDRYGVAVTLIFVAIVFGWKAGRYLGNRLFGEDRGLLTWLVSETVQFMKDLKEMLKRATAGQEDQGRKCDMCTTRHADTGPCSTIPVRRSLTHQSDALQTIADHVGAGDAVREHLARAKDELFPMSGTLATDPPSGPNRG